MESPRFENQSDAEDYIRELESKKANITCKYCQVSYGIGLDGKVSEASVHCQYAPEIDYKEIIK